MRRGGGGGGGGKEEGSGGFGAGVVVFESPHGVAKGIVIIT